MASGGFAGSDLFMMCADLADGAVQSPGPDLSLDADVHRGNLPPGGWDAPGRANQSDAVQQAGGCDAPGRANTG